MCRELSQHDGFRRVTCRLKQAWTVSSLRKRSSVSYSILCHLNSKFKFLNKMN